MLRAMGVGAVLAACCAALSISGAEAVSQKLDRIQSGKLRPGTRIDFFSGELNAWIQAEAAKYFPGAIRNIRIDPGFNAATGHADIDFVKLRQDATGETPGWLMRNLFSGERSVVVKARVASAHGSARVDIDQVQISGVPIEGRTLDFLIRNYVRPTFPEVKIGEWFRLADRVDHLTVSPSGVAVFIGR